MSVCLYLVLDIWHAKRIPSTPFTVSCGLPGCTTAFHIISNKRYDFQKKVAEHKMCVSFLSTTYV